MAEHESVYSCQQLVNHFLFPLSFWQSKQEQQKQKKENCMVHFKVKKHSFSPPAKGALYPSRLFSERDWELRSSKDMSAFP